MKKSDNNITPRSSRGLADMMFDELDALKAGDSTPQQARAKASIANVIISVSRLEMDYSRFVSNERSDNNLTGPAPIALGSNAAS